MRGNHYYDEFHIKHPFAIVFRFAATVWPLVLPYCVANIASLSLLTLTKKYTRVDVSILPTAHAMMSILISYLGVSKTGCGHVMMTLRELNQLAITVTEQYTSPAATAWRCQTKDAIVQLIHETVAVLRDERHSAALARNVGHRTGVGIDLSSKIGTRGSVQGARVITSGSDDPMVLVHSLRSHLYTESDRVCRKNDGTGEVKIELFERCKMIDQLHEFTVSYRNLLRLASSPLPFPLVQMGRTFTAVWTLSLPFVLIGDDFAEDSLSTFTFVILLTYGFLGLEFLSRMLANPFGDELAYDFNIQGMGSAAIVGIEDDSGTRGRAPDGGLEALVSKRQRSIQMSTRYIVLDGSKEWANNEESRPVAEEMIDYNPYYSYRSTEEEDSPSVFL